MPRSASPGRATTVFPSRSARGGHSYAGFSNSDGLVIEANLAWQEDFYAAMRPYLSGGAYQNFPDPTLADWPRAYYGANLERLVETKRGWDPDNLFRYAQSIPVAS